MSDGRISPHDAAELAAFFTACAGDLFGYGCVLARGDPAAADDLVQAAFASAGQAWPTLRGMAEEQRRDWLRRTLADIAVGRLRRGAALRDRLPRIEVRSRKVEAGPLEETFSPAALERCWQAITEMPEQQYAVALLRWQLDMKEAEIATVLGITGKTVSTHLHRARRKLLAQLGPDHPVTPGGQDGAPS